MSYSYITIDTQVFEKNSFNLKSGILHELTNINNTHVKLAISEITISETKRRLAELIKSTRDAILSLSSKNDAIDVFDIKSATDLARNISPRTIASNIIDEFLVECEAHIVKYEEISIRSVLDLYFGSQPPFRGSGAKKAEFPDAIALLSLEKFAETHGSRILAVSGDGDWVQFCNKSQHIDISETLKEALDKIQTDRESAIIHFSNFVSKATKSIRDNGSTQRVMLESILRKRVHHMNFSAIGNSWCHVVSDFPSVKYIRDSLVFTSNPDSAKFSRISPLEISAYAAIEFEIEANAEFSFYSDDPEAMDAEFIGTTSIARNFTIETDAVVKLRRNNPESEFELFDLDDMKYNQQLNFGYIDPQGVLDADEIDEGEYEQIDDEDIPDITQYYNEDDLPF